MNREELISLLAKATPDTPVFIGCANNLYDIGKVFLIGDRIILEVGDVNNPE